jgi:hypothetical protein
VSDALQGRRLWSAVGNKNFCGGMVKFHECGGNINDPNYYLACGFNGLRQLPAFAIILADQPIRCR